MPQEIGFSHGHITKQGSKWHRLITIEVVLHCIRKPGHLQGFYLRIRKRKGESVDRVATARKFLERIYHML